MTKRDKILGRIVNMISTTAPDSEVYLYGSHARGDSNKTSDWDLLVLLNMNNVSFDYETRIMDDFYEIELETGEVISPLVYSKNDWRNNHSFTPLYENIEKEGVRLK
jgi:predicted nucleotidyltransferase